MFTCVCVVYVVAGRGRAGNASGINDGAAMVLLMSRDKATALGLAPLATFKSFASAGVDPEIMGVGPIPASQAALRKVCPAALLHLHLLLYLPFSVGTSR